MPTPSSAAHPIPGRSFLWLPLAALAAVAVLLAVYHYFTGDDLALPVQAVAQLKPVPTVLAYVPAGLAELPVRVNGYLLTQTHDLVGPYVRPEAAYGLLLLLGGALVYFLAVASALPRPTFVAAMAGLIFLLMSLNADLLGIFNSQKQYFLVLMLAAFVLPAYAFHAFWPEVPLGRRLVLFAGLVLGVGGLLVQRSELPLDATALHLASFFTNGGAILVALLVLWVAFENLNGLLWFNTQAENPASRFGLLPFVAASVLYVGMLGLYVWNDGDLLLLPGLHLDPLVLLLPAVVIGWLGLPRRAAAAADWLPYRAGVVYLYPVLALLAAAALGYAFATANDPLLLAARHLTALMLFVGGAAYLLYVLVNFGPLIRQRLRVYRVVYEPRRLPLFAVYVLLIAGVGAVEFRNNFATLYQVQAGYYNNLGDLTRLQSEQEPSRDALALLAERYYAESDILDEHNHKASLGRAALYRFRLQRQNEINILRRALSRRPSEKISLRLAALYNEPNDFFDQLAVLREGLKNAPNSPRLNNDLAHLYSRSTLSDSVNWYLNRAEAADPGSTVVQTNRLAFLLQNKQFADAWRVARTQSTSEDAAWQSNVLLLQRLNRDSSEPILTVAVNPSANLTIPEFARLYHAALWQVQQADTSYLPALTQLVQRPSNASYFEQLTFLRVLMQHYGGQPVLARTTLAPLLAGNTPSAAYYQNLEALWLLEQRAYGSAATTFAAASRNGYPEAKLHRAYALALNQQPDSARAAVVAALVQPDTALQRPARQLQQVLALSYPQEYNTAPTPIQAQYVALLGYILSPPDMLAAAERLPEGRLRKAALLAQLPRALQAGQLAAAAQAVARFAPASTQQTPEASAWNVVRGDLLLRQQNTAGLRQLVADGYFTPLQQPYRLAYQAALADQAGQTKEAGQLYRRLLQEAPFVEPGVLAAAAFYERQKDYLGAYGALQAALEYNPESIPLLKAYALAAIPAGLAEYATTSLTKLRPLLSPAEYATFRILYDARLAAQAAAAAPWN